MKEGEWISAEEALPGFKYIEVLVHIKGSYYFNLVATTEFEDYPWDKVDYWMYIPDLPR